MEKPLKEQLLEVEQTLEALDAEYERAIDDGIDFIELNQLFENLFRLQGEIKQKIYDAAVLEKNQLT